VVFPSFPDGLSVKAQRLRQVQTSSENSFSKFVSLLCFMVDISELAFSSED
jgi:hypothetical protein